MARPAPAAYLPGPPPSLDDLVEVAAGRARHCECKSPELQVRLAETRDAIRAAVLRKDWTAVKLLAATPRIPIAACVCRPPAQLRGARLLALRPRAPLACPIGPRPPGAAQRRIGPPALIAREREREELRLFARAALPIITGIPCVPRRDPNACFMGWPGGVNWFPPGAPLPAGWTRTRFENGIATNPRCFGTNPSLLERLSGGGDLFTAAREARTASALLAAAEEEAARRARWRLFFSQPLPKDALSLREVEGACGKKPGPWACFSRWPGGWLPFDHPNVKANPDVWKGPTNYGLLLPECFGFTPALSEKLGRWAGRLTRAVTAAIITSPATTPAALPLAPALTTPPPGGFEATPGEPILECFQVNLYGGRYGETRTGPRSSSEIAAVNGAPGWQCREVG